MSKTKFHEDRLVSALNKYYRAIDDNEYWKKMDIPMTNNAIAVSSFPKEITDWIWETERAPFEIF